jgi:O-antigen ligase
MHRYFNGIRLSELEIFTAISVVGVAAVVLLYQPTLIFAAALAVPLLILLRKPSLILYLLVGIAMMRIDAWVSYTMAIPFGKVVFLLTVVTVILVLSLTKTDINRPGVPVRAFIFFLGSYLVFGLVNATPNGVRFWLEDSAYAVSYFLVIYLLVNRWSKLEKVFYLIALIGVIVSVVNIVEFFNPRAVSLSHSMGRTAGLLKNSNTSAMIINVAMMAILYPLRVTGSRRVTLLLVIAEVCLFFGVFTTFSREGIIVFSMIFLSQFFFVRQKARRFMIIAVTGIILTLATIKIIEYISFSAIGDVRYSFRRITTLVHGQVDSSDRFQLLKYHLECFARRPFTGYGLYSAMMYSVHSSGISETMVSSGPHNTFAIILSETGIIPFLFYLVFLGSVFKNLIGMMVVAGSDLRMKSLAICSMLLFGLLIIHHLFSHMMIVSRYSMVLFALFSLPPSIFASVEKCQSGDI